MLKIVGFILLIFPSSLVLGQNDEEKDDFFFANFQIEKRANFHFLTSEDYRDGVEVNGALTIDVLANKNYVVTFSSEGKSYFESQTGDEMPVTALAARSNSGKWTSLSANGSVLIQDPHCYNKNEKRHPSATKDCYHEQAEMYLPCRQYFIDYKVSLPNLYSDGTYTIEMTYEISRP